jgi:hypothetical protein
MTSTTDNKERKRRFIIVRLPLGEWGIYRDGICVRIVRITCDSKIVNT